MSDQIDIGRFWTATGLHPAQGLRGPVLSSGTSSVRAFVKSRARTFDFIRDFFRYDEDVKHMLYGDPDRPHLVFRKFNLRDYDDVRQNAEEILTRVSLQDTNDPMRMRMPPYPADRWPQQIIDQFNQWIAAGMPP